MDRAARSLGEDEAGAVRRVHAPLIQGAMWTAALLVLVDVLKELPATLILRHSTSTPWRSWPTATPATSAWARPPGRPC
ncbi:MAG: hypothetical protein WDM92_11975 [Caulobacteraceae bacterium]